MDDNTAQRQQFEELAEQLSSCNDEDVLAILVDAREDGLVARGLDDTIRRLRDGEIEPAEAIAWAYTMIDESVAEAVEPDASGFSFSGVSTTTARPVGASEEGPSIVVNLEEESDTETPDEADDERLDMDLFEDMVESDDGDMFDDLGDILAEAGQRAIDDAPGFKLPELDSPKKKLSLSGDARKRLSKKFSLPSPTKSSNSPVGKAGGSDDDDDGKTPIAGLDAIQGLVANSSQDGSVPDIEAEQATGEPELDFDIGLDDLLEESESAPGVLESSSEPSSVELSLDSESEASEVLELARTSEPTTSDSEAMSAESKPEPESEPESEPEPEPEPEPESEPEPKQDSSNAGGGFGMGSLFDDDELAEIEGAGKKEPEPSSRLPRDGSQPGIRYETGKSGARYAGKAPPPPTHRLRSGSNPGPSMTGFEVEDDSDDDFDLDFGPSSDGNSFGAGANVDEAPAGEDDDDFDFDLGLENPEKKSTGTPGVPMGQPEQEDDFDFDLGFENPAKKAEEVTPPIGQTGYSEADFDLDFDDMAADTGQHEVSGSVTKGPPGIPNPGGTANTGSSTEETEDYDELRKKAVRSDVIGSEPRREANPTPIRQEAVRTPNRAQQPTPMAQDRGGGDVYRGEPLLREDSSEASLDFDMEEAGDNPFAHEAPTGVRHAAVESSFVLEEVSHAEDGSSTNLAAVLLEARRLYENAQFDEAMTIVEKVLSREESDGALQLKQAIEGELERVELDKIGSLAKVPSLEVDMGDIASLDLDHRAGFLLSQIDGTMAFEDLLELSAMSRFETLTVLSDLLEKGVIAVD